MSDLTKADPAETNHADPYRVAAEFGIRYGKMDAEYTDEDDLKVILTPQVEYLLRRSAHWSAWRASRNTAVALLEKAKEFGLSKEQMAALDAVAEEYAYD